MGLQDKVLRCLGARLVASHAAVFDFYLHLLDILSITASAGSLAATVRMGKKDAITGCGQ
jgi:hypothetical protein